MTILITSHEVSEHGTHYIELTNGKKDCSVSFSSRGVQVCCKNASHAAWGGFGRQFGSFADAVDGYKSSAMKAMIEVASDAVKPQLSVV